MPLIGRRARILAAASLLLASTAAAEDGGVSFSDEERRRIAQHSPLAPRPESSTNRVADDPRAARLGQFLFFEKRLSVSGEHACATCHDPDRRFTDGQQVFEALGVGTRNTPTLWNVAYNRWFFWDGRADTLWSQALQPIENPKEMGSNRLAVAHLIHRDPDLRRAYEALFGALPALSDAHRFPRDGRPAAGMPVPQLERAWSNMTAADRDAVNRVFANVGKAIAAYQRRLITPESAFDRFARALRSDDAAGMRAISDAAQRGLKLFVGRANCRLCHTGPNFSDGEFHNTRVPPRTRPPVDAARLAGVPAVLRDPFNAAGRYSDDPTGAEARWLEYLTNKWDNGMAFKTPTLRNIAATAPYMHEGQFATLDEVVHYYSTLAGALPVHHAETVLKPLELSAQQRADLVAFLESLTSDPADPALLAQPSSPSVP